MIRAKRTRRWAWILRLLRSPPQRAAKKASQVGDEFWRQAAPGAADQPAGFDFVMTAIARVDDGAVWALISQDLQLFKCRSEGVAVIRVASEAAHADHAALVQCRGDADLAAELVPHCASPANPIAPACQRRRIERQAVLDEGLAGEMLTIRVLNSKTVAKWQARAAVEDMMTAPMDAGQPDR